MKVEPRLTRERLSPFASLLRGAAVDRAVGYAIMGNIAALVIGPVTALIIAARFTSELQGYYYTFGSLATLQVLMDLGLGQAIIQFASHEWINLSFQPGFVLTGEPDARSRLISLGRLSIRWYSLAAVVTFLGLGLIGFILFSRSTTPAISWTWPWFSLCLGVAANVLLSPFYYLLQGCQQVAPFWFYRLIQQVVNGVVLWGAIVLGAKLWAQPIATACGLAWSTVFLSRYVKFLKTFLAQPAGDRISWRTEVWPIQWRIAITWISTNFVSQAFTPILFLYGGPVIAGQMGMTITLVNVLIAISANWVVPKAPRFGSLVATKNWTVLDKVFFRSLYVSLAVAILMAASSVAVIRILNETRHPLANRLLPLAPAGILLAAGIFSSLLSNLAVYLRAHKREPLMPVFFWGSTAIIILAVILAGAKGAVGVGSAFLAVLAFFEFPTSLLIFLKLRRSWHSGPKPILDTL